MSSGRRFAKAAGVFVLGIALQCIGISTAKAETQQSPTPAHSQRKAKKPQKAQKRQPDPLPIGPTGPIQPMPLDTISPVPPQVNYQNGELTIVAPNSTLADILRAVRKQTGAEIDVPAAPERVVTHLGPGPARAVVAELLNGSRFNYVLLGSPADDTMLTRVVLVAKSGPDISAVSRMVAQQQQQQPQQPDAQAGNTDPQQPVEADAADAEAPAEEAPEEAADQQAAEADQQPAPPPDQPGVKTPQQMLQEMQQRQLQMQQQQQQGVPGMQVPQRQPEQQ